MTTVEYRQSNWDVMKWRLFCASLREKLCMRIGNGCIRSHIALPAVYVDNWTYSSLKGFNRVKQPLHLTRVRMDYSAKYPERRLVATKLYVDDWTYSSLKGFNRVKQPVLLTRVRMDYRANYPQRRLVATKRNSLSLLGIETLPSSPQAVRQTEKPGS